MAIKTQSDVETGVAHNEELDALQAILTARGETISYEETVEIGRELVGFFEALGKENEQPADEEDIHA